MAGPTKLNVAASKSCKVSPPSIRPYCHGSETAALPRTPSCFAASRRFARHAELSLSNGFHRPHRCRLSLARTSSPHCHLLPPTDYNVVYDLRVPRLRRKGQKVLLDPQHEEPRLRLPMPRVHGRGALAHLRFPTEPHRSRDRPRRRLLAPREASSVIVVYQASV